MNSFYAILLIFVGSLCASSFYVPIRQIKNWSWESYWAVQGVFAWIIVPLLFTFLTVPSGTFMAIFSESPSSAKLAAMFYGVLWGVGGLTFGLSMRYLGVSLGQSIALGFCAAFGTLVPPLMAGQSLFASKEGILMVIGVAVCVAGICIIGYAGQLKSKNMSDEERRAAVKDFALKKGLLFAILAGVMSACFAFGLKAGDAIAQTALQYHTSPLFSSNPVIVFVTFGGFITNISYCIFLNVKNSTYKDYTQQPSSIILSNIFFAALSGVLWYLQFFFYGMGSSKMPVSMVAFSWSILMALNIALSNIWGILLNEWKGAKTSTMTILIVGILVLILSSFVVKLG